MRTIIKRAEPKSLVAHRQANPDSDYAGYPDKITLRNALLNEQRGICCYCMGRIRRGTNDNKMKVEHWQCQERYPSDQPRATATYLVRAFWQRTPASASAALRYQQGKQGPYVESGGSRTPDRGAHTV